jgi:hypothetical protein
MVLVTTTPSHKQILSVFPRPSFSVKMQFVIAAYMPARYWIDKS